MRHRRDCRISEGRTQMLTEGLQRRSGGGVYGDVHRHEILVSDFERLEMDRDRWLTTRNGGPESNGIGRGGKRDVRLEGWERRGRLNRRRPHLHRRFNLPCRALIRY